MNDMNLIAWMLDPLLTNGEAAHLAARDAEDDAPCGEGERQPAEGFLAAGCEMPEAVCG